MNSSSLLFIRKTLLISGDLVMYSNLIELSCKLHDYSKANSGMTPDPVAYGSMINVLGKAKLFLEALQLIEEMRDSAILPDIIEEATWLFHQAIEAGDVKDTSLSGCMINLYSRNKKYANVTEVFEKMRGARYFPDSNVIALVLNAYGKLRNFEKANAVYREMQDEGCVIPNVHFQSGGVQRGKKEI
ncbi:Pentatricopeptide repeat [Dillenia turbinata]|uniref:Pentatricopeptide repeat n=1 Tax=Dillenia turbinata TaxID=194707 RepID=A0AAN8UL50_9MAGN